LCWAKADEFFRAQKKAPTPSLIAQVSVGRRYPVLLELSQAALARLVMGLMRNQCHLFKNGNKSLLNKVLKTFPGAGPVLQCASPWCALGLDALQ